ncbi:MAG: peptidyl-prolyl cis-trans isomerase [bacterium]
MIRCFFLSLSILLICAGCGGGAKPQRGGDSEIEDLGGMVAIVNGDIITEEDLSRRFPFSEEDLSTMSDKEREDFGEARRNSLYALIDEKIILQRAMALKLEVSEEEIDERVRMITSGADVGGILRDQNITMEEWRERIRDGILIEKTVDYEVGTKVEIKDSEVKDYYNEHRNEFNLPAMVKIRQVIVQSEGEAERALDSIRGGRDFVDVAAEFSTGGIEDRLLYHTLDELPEEFQNAIQGMNVGDVSGIVKTPFGYHILKLEERVAPHTRTYEEAYDEIKEKLLEGKKEGEFRKWIALLRKKSEVRINPKYIEGKG